MSSIRNNTVRSNGTGEESLLDAARDCVLAVGWRRTTMTDVARRAGVSRMTVYRRWPDMNALTADLMTREFTGAGTALHEDAGTPISAAEIARAVTTAATQICTDPLFVKMVDVDPELLLPYLLNRRGRVQDLLLSTLTSHIRAGQRHGDVRKGRPDVLARTVLLLAHGYVVSSSTMIEDRYTDRIARRELTTAVESYLR